MQKIAQSSRTSTLGCPNPTIACLSKTKCNPKGFQELQQLPCCTSTFLVLRTTYLTQTLIHGAHEPMYPHSGSYSHYPLSTAEKPCPYRNLRNT